MAFLQHSSLYSADRTTTMTSSSSISSSSCSSFLLMDDRRHHRYPSETLDMQAMAALQPAASPSQTLAIHYYTELARKHKDGVIPYLPRIMKQVLGSLSWSPQLHEACAEVVSSLASHTIGPGCNPASNEEALRAICRPLLNDLCSLEPAHLAPGAAICLKALVESDRWRCAPLDLQELACDRGTLALSVHGPRTISHIHLMQSLAKRSSSIVIQFCGSRLLSSGMDILQKPSLNADVRLAAAQLLQSILDVAGSDLLDLDLSPIIDVLEDCRRNNGMLVGVGKAQPVVVNPFKFSHSEDGGSQITSEFVNSEDDGSHVTSEFVHSDDDNNVTSQYTHSEEDGVVVDDDYDDEDTCNFTSSSLKPGNHVNQFNNKDMASEGINNRKHMPQKSKMLNNIVTPLQGFQIMSDVASPYSGSNSTCHVPDTGSISKPGNFPKRAPLMPLQQNITMASAEKLPINMYPSLAYKENLPPQLSKSLTKNLTEWIKKQQALSLAKQGNNLNVNTNCLDVASEDVCEGFCLSTIERDPISSSNFKRGHFAFTADMNSGVSSPGDSLQTDGSKSCVSVVHKKHIDSPVSQGQSVDSGSVMSYNSETDMEVTGCRSFTEDLLITPQGQICPLQCSDIYTSESEQVDGTDSEFEQSIKTQSVKSMDHNLDNDEVVGYADNNTIDIVSNASNANSVNLVSEEIKEMKKQDCSVSGDQPAVCAGDVSPVSFSEKVGVTKKINQTQQASNPETILNRDAHCGSCEQPISLKEQIKLLNQAFEPKKSNRAVGFVANLFKKLIFIMGIVFCVSIFLQVAENRDRSPALVPT